MIVHTRLDSAHLAGNLLGDPSERDLFVYLPPGYEDSDRRYPTAYLWSEVVYDYSATYSPNPDNPPFYVDLPVAWPSGELLQDVWDRWLSFDPVVNVHDRLDNLRKLAGILLDAGSHAITTCTGAIGC